MLAEWASRGTRLYNNSFTNNKTMEAPNKCELAWSLGRLWIWRELRQEKEVLGMVLWEVTLSCRAQLLWIIHRKWSVGLSSIWGQLVMMELIVSKVLDLSILKKTGRWEELELLKRFKSSTTRSNLWELQGQSFYLTSLMWLPSLSRSKDLAPSTVVNVLSFKVKEVLVLGARWYSLETKTLPLNLKLVALELLQPMVILTKTVATSTLILLLQDQLLVLRPLTLNRS